MLGALATLAVVAVGPATAVKVVNVKSTVTIKAGEGSEFTGKVTSARRSAARGER